MYYREYKYISEYVDGYLLHRYHGTESIAIDVIVDQMIRVCSDYCMRRLGERRMLKFNNAIIRDIALKV